MQERIDEILAQETINENDIKFLMSNISLVSEIGKARLGLIPVIEVMPVKKEKTLEPAPKVETPKKKVIKNK
jgi:hypothetical protein